MHKALHSTRDHHVTSGRRDECRCPSFVFFFFFGFPSFLHRFLFFSSSLLLFISSYLRLFLYVFQHVTEHDYSFTMRNTITEDKVTNTCANEDKTAVDAPTSRTGLALCCRCHPAWASEGTLVGPGKDTHGSPVPAWWRRPWVAHNKLHTAPPTRQNQGYRDAPWLPTLLVFSSSLLLLSSSSPLLHFSSTPPFFSPIFLFLLVFLVSYFHFTLFHPSLFVHFRSFSPSFLLLCRSCPSLSAPFATVSSF